MPEVSGIETATRLKQSGSTAKVIFLTIHDDFDFIGAALKTGADGYVFKTRMAIDLLLAVHEVLAGRTFLSPLSSRN
jgi:DNA-binding NarL/FixJ family response regulator